MRVKFAEDIRHPGFRLQGLLGEGGTTTVFKVQDPALENRIVALRIPQFRNNVQSNELVAESLNSMMGLSKALDNLEGQIHLKFPIVKTIRGQTNLYSVVPIVNKELDFRQFLERYSAGESSATMQTLKEDLVTFFKETSSLTFVGDLSSDNLIYSRNQWVILDYQKKISRMQAIGDPTLADQGSLLFYEHESSPAVLNLESELRQEIATARTNPGSVPAFSPAWERGVIGGYKTRINPLGKCGTLRRPAMSSSVSLRRRIFQNVKPLNGAAVARTGATALFYAASIISLLDLGSNPYATDGSVAGAVCAEAIPNLNRLGCSWQFRMNPLNNYVECTVLLTAHPVRRHALDTRNNSIIEEVCQGRAKNFAVSLDNAEGRARVRALGVFELSTMPLVDVNQMSRQVKSMLTGFPNQTHDYYESNEYSYPPPQVEPTTGVPEDCC